MSYRNHRFSFEHVAQRAGIAGVVPRNSSDVADTDTAGAKARLIDDQNKRLYTCGGDTPAGGERRIWVDTAASGIDNVPVNRLIIPDTHNMRATGFAIFLQQSKDNSTWNTIALNNGELVWHWGCGVVDLEFDASYWQRYLRFRVSSVITPFAQLGEVFWTRIFQPQFGIVQSWELPQSDANQSTTIMESGDEYTELRGQSSRRFRAEVRSSDGNDLRRYRELFESAQTHRPFWYDHSDSNEAQTIVEEMDTTSGWTPSNCSLALANGPSAAANDSVEMTSSASGVALMDKTLGSAEDWTGKLVSLDVRFVAPAFITAATGIAVLLFSENGTNVRYSEYHLGTPVWRGQLANSWHRLCFDPTMSDATGPNSSVDLRDINIIRVQFTATAGSQVMRVANITTWEKNAQPVRVRFTETPRVVQDNKYPNGSLGPSYTVSMSMKEVIS